MNFDEFLALKPSQLIREAVHDVDKARAKGIRLDLDTWCEYKRTDKKIQFQVCSVCLAGSTLLGFFPKFTDDPDRTRSSFGDLPDGIRNRMFALDMLRKGFPQAFCNIMQINDHSARMPWPRDSINTARRFEGKADTRKRGGYRWSVLKKALLDVADYFKKEGL